MLLLAPFGRSAAITVFGYAPAQNFTMSYLYQYAKGFKRFHTGVKLSLSLLAISTF